MPRINKIKARQILDSRGNPTVETAVILDNGLSAQASVPSGASRGKHEAMELRDGDPDDYLGKSVHRAVDNVNRQINRLLSGFDIEKQAQIDQKMIELDGTGQKEKLGANAILSVSAACLKASAKAADQPYYQRISELYGHKSNSKEVIPLFNVINGGLHGASQLTIQEFMVIPSPTLPFEKALAMGAIVYQTIRADLVSRKLAVAVGDEGGFIPDSANNNEALLYLQKIIARANLTSNRDICLGLDFASSTYFKDGYYAFSDETLLSSKEYLEKIISLQKEFGLILLEDPLSEDDWENWTELTAKIGDQLKIVGDDLLVTNGKRLSRAIETKACNSILIKINQIGTISETLEVMKQASENGFSRIVSHRSGETNDDLIADLAVGTDTEFVKFGAPARGERIAKYNRLSEIYRKL